MPTDFTFTITGGTSPSTGSSATPGSAAGAVALRDEKLDRLTGNLVLSTTDADQVMVYGVEGIASDLRAAWQVVKGEWFLNLDEGVDYFGLVFVKNPDLGAIRQEFTRVALLVPGVAEVVSFVPLIDTATRTMRASFEVRCDTGAVISAVNAVLLSLGVA